MTASDRRNIAVRVEDDVIIVVHNERPPSDPEWDLYVRAYQHTTGAVGVRFQLVFTTGGGPNAAQRKRAAVEGERIFTQRGLPIPRTAVMTPSATMRGLVTLFNWMFPGRYSAFEPDNLRGALEYIERPAEDHDRFRAIVDAMRREIGA